ncbi:CPBP family intramembrane glutamic endopeptidase [Shouchella lonarensis]|uniref:CAAX prenyl protease 2/Lysostaphin resistance protein A-like domain-containing protein n=1 Tax=Shouchella lonarensis TaxID=1464122 RepID=A0A1G6HZ29_9BACI|nr:type II CAAX endopeptidase family protein [Shouchella lonarensis]SDB99085.1 hypothetical protein SAMN05421737_104228 [Shouchella lonarensis]
MTKRYFLIVLTYIVMQTGFMFVVARSLSHFFDIADGSVLLGLTAVISFSIGLLVMLLLLRKDSARGGDLPGEKSTIGSTIGWSALGVVIVFVAQMTAGLIETYIFGIEPGSKNTAELVSYARDFWAMILVIAVLGPIIEEIVFRKAIFGWLYVRTNFFIAALASSLVFAVVHMDFEHMLLYTTMGFTFAFLYTHTKRLIVPIIAHVSLNSFVILTQVIFYDQIVEYLERHGQTIPLIFPFLLGV